VSIGIVLNIKMDRTKFQRGSWSKSLEMLYEDEMEDIQKISKAVGRIRKKNKLDDYGIFRMVWDMFDQLGLRFGRKHRRFSQALYYKNWSQGSCLIVLARILRNNGLRVVPLFQENSVGLLFDVGVEYQLLNALRLEYNWISGFSIKGVVWDGKDRMGAIRIRGTLPERMDLKEEQKLRPFSFRKRTIPSFIKRNAKQKSIPFYGTSHNIGYQLYPCLTSYLKFFPSFSFGEQIELAWQEVRCMRFQKDLHRIYKETKDELEFMNILCRSIQSYTTYTPGPLRAISAILTERKGDCDQLSMLISALLFEVGYSSEDIMGCFWPRSEESAGHILLAIRPKDKGPEDGAKIVMPNRGTFFCLDPTYYVRSHNGRFQSSWGRISDKYRGETSSVPIRIRYIRK
jgi:hypothetical protein